MSRYSVPPATFEVTCESVTSRWLGEKSAFRLEVSWAELGRRHRRKAAQALDNTYGWGACVVV